jgi:hypothetical protein
MEDITAIGKSKKNVAQGYQFRGIDDVYNEIHEILTKHKVFTVPEVVQETHEERPTKSGGLSIYRILKIKYKFYSDDGSSVEATVIGEGMDSGDKASNKAQSVAHKYALLQVFCIPTEDAKDPELDSHDLKTTETKPKAQKSSEKYQTPTSEPTYTKAEYSDATVKRVTSLKHGELKGKDCLKQFIPDYNKKFGTEYKNVVDFNNDELINKLMDFITSLPPKGI